MGLAKKLIIVLTILLSLSFVNATQEQIRVDLEEYVNQTVVFNPLLPSVGTYIDPNENQTYYNITGYVTVYNQNPNGKTMSDIYVSLLNTTRLLGTPVNTSGRPGTFVDSDVTDGLIILHIPELRTGESSTWRYDVNTTATRPPINFTSNYSARKVLAGDGISVNDTISNTFDNAAYQSSTCISNINVTQIQTPINTSGVFYNFTFNVSTLAGVDSPNVTIQSPLNHTLNWFVRGGECIAIGAEHEITYDMTTPVNIPLTSSYNMINATLQYQLNSTVSQMRVSDIAGISEANLSFEKQIIGPSDDLLFGSNVTWNVTGDFLTASNITYNLTEVTFWVSQRNVNGSYTDPNTIDNDTITGTTPLNVTYNPFVLVNITTPWNSADWLFNYSDLPSPIVWMDVNFTIQNDGTQLVNRTFTRNGTDIYLKELFIIIGYWLEIEKNITNIAANEYSIDVDVHNKGNQMTPVDAVVTVYDFVPSNYRLNSSFSYASSPWYFTSQANTTILGAYNGTLYQWAIIANNSINTSLAEGPTKTENSTWSVSYNVTGEGDYQLLDIFITGLDPQQVDGAGSTKSVIVSQIINKIKSTEGVFAVVAGILLLLGLLA